MTQPRASYALLSEQHAWLLPFECGTRVNIPGISRLLLILNAQGPTIFPIDADGRIYALQDETGNTIGTGTREVCEVSALHCHEGGIAQ